MSEAQRKKLKIADPLKKGATPEVCEVLSRALFLSLANNNDTTGHDSLAGKGQTARLFQRASTDKGRVDNGRRGARERRREAVL